MSVDERDLVRETTEELRRPARVRTENGMITQAEFERLERKRKREATEAKRKIKAERRAKSKRAKIATQTARRKGKRR